LAAIEESKTTGALLRVKDLRTHILTPRGVVKAVDGVSFDIKPGEILGIVGESGSGKTMTALSIAGLLPSPPAEIKSGQVEMNGRDLLRLTESEMREVRGQEISMVFQDPLTSLNPLMKVGDQISETIRVHRKTDRTAARGTALEILRQVGMPEPEARSSEYPFELSGGMRQRVMIAIAIAASPRLIIADEPTTNLDATIQAQILSLLKSIRDTKGTSILLITHNLGIVAWVCDRVAVMYAGRVVEMGPTRKVLGNPLHPYTKALISAIPRIDTHGKLEAIPGDIPSLIDLPEACNFNPRCPLARDVCRRKDPPSVEVEEDHAADCFVYTEDWQGAS
jgi:oligopeptide/dipeptide ABC transporter ATP-binding protein